MISGIGSMLGQGSGSGPASLTDSEAIEANRRGIVTPEQKARLNPLMREGAGCLRSLMPAINLAGLSLFGIFGLAFIQAPWWGYVGLVLLVLLVLFVVLAIPAIGVLRRWQALNQDVAANQIAQGDGQLVYGRDQYEAQIPDRRLRLTQRGQLSVGERYHFYYLPTSGLVLSAESRGALSPMQAMQNLTESLASANRFQTGALAANREGRLALTQMPRLLPRLLWGGVLVLIAAAVAVSVFVPGWLRGDFSVHNTNSPVAVIVLAIFVLVGLYTAFTALGDGLLGRAVVVEGPGSKLVTYRRGSSYQTGSATGQRARNSITGTYYYQIGSRRFQVHPRAFEALIDGVPYRAYYTLLSRSLVNVEATAPPDGSMRS